MKMKKFTKEEVKLLRKNPYTLRVTESTISFTLAFKQRFWQGLQEGLSNAELLEEMGYDLEILGPTRVMGIGNHIRQDARSPEGIHSDKRTKRPYVVNEDTSSDMPESQQLHRLQAEVSYLRQQIEFLKKIMQAENSRGQRK